MINRQVVIDKKKSLDIQTFFCFYHNLFLYQRSCKASFFSWRIKYTHPPIPLGKRVSVSECLASPSESSETRTAAAKPHGQTRPPPICANSFCTAVHICQSKFNNIVTVKPLSVWIRITVKFSVWLSGIFIFLFQCVNFMFRNSVYKLYQVKHFD